MPAGGGTVELPASFWRAGLGDASLAAGGGIIFERSNTSLNGAAPNGGHGQGLGANAGLGALNILVVDDNPQMRSIIGTVLAAAGVGHLHYAPDGRYGLRTLMERTIDVVYVDYEMPHMNGLRFLSAVRELDSDRRYTPVIMLTGHSDLLRLNAARDRGVTEFLAKPVSARSVLSRLSAVIFRPRPFIQCDTFFGPDRRRHGDAEYAGPRRRAADQPRPAAKGAGFLEL